MEIASFREPRKAYSAGLWLNTEVNIFWVDK